MSPSAVEDCHGEVFPLSSAVYGGDRKMVECLLQNGSEIETYPNKLPVLHFAIMKDQLEIVELLLQYGADIEENCDQISPLLLAIFVGNLTVIELLLRNGAKTGGCPGRSPALHFAIRTEEWEIVELLLRYGADTEELDKDGKFSPLCRAISWSNRKIVERLLHYGADANVEVTARTRNLSPLTIAVMQSDPDIVELLLRNGAHTEVRPGQPTPLNTAVLKGCRKVVDLLLEYGAYVEGLPNEALDFALFTAVIKDHRGIVEVLLQNGANISGDPDWQILNIAIAFGQINIVKVLFCYGANWEDDMQCLLFLSKAAKKGHFHAIKVVLHTCLNTENTNGVLLEAEPLKLFQQPQLFRHLLGSCPCNPESKQLCTKQKQRFDDRPTNFYSFRSFYNHHLIKVCAANLHPLAEVLDSSPFWDIIGTNGENYRKECLSEVGVMKNLNVGGSNLTFFDILTMDVSRVTCCFKNSRIAQVLNSNYVYKTFPKYANILNCQFQTGKRRNTALKEGVKDSIYLSGLFQTLPSEIIAKILDHLSLEDLLNFKDTCCRIVL